MRVAADAGTLACRVDSRTERCLRSPVQAALALQHLHRGSSESVRYRRPVATDEETILKAPLDVQVASFLDEHRAMLADSLEGLTESEVRQQLVPSKTTLLGLVKHAVFVEKVWFDEAVTGRSRADIGIPNGPDESFDLGEDDTIESVRADFLEAVAASRNAVSGLGLEDIVRGNRRGPLPLRWVYLHVIRELAQHCGHADILREQVMAARSAPARL
jgi:Protein of unknown function (DUF664)